MTQISLNCLDVLSGIEKLNICTHYEYNGEKIEYYPANLNELKQCTPVYKQLDGWDEDITTVEHFDELPANAKTYIKTIEELIGIEVAIFSVGPDRKQTIVR